PLRNVRPTPSSGRHWMCEGSTPPCRMRSSTRWPTSLSTSAVTTAVRSPKQRRNPRATLYSPPPSHTWNERVVRIRPSPGSRRSITSPSATRSYRQSVASRMHSSTGLGGESGDRRPVSRGDQGRRHHPTAADREDRRDGEVRRQQGRGDAAGRDEPHTPEWGGERLDRVHS